MHLSRWYVVKPILVAMADPLKIETLPTRSQDVQPLQNVLSISTAGKNRYLLHFNSLHSLTQWTAGIRLAMYEHATLQEAYTGSLIAGKGKTLNNIKTIMDKTRFAHEDWARVRFGAGTPWRRCWCVIAPPDEKDVKQHQKHIKKRSAYERPVALKGTIKFYDTTKIKKATPIATINDAYSAYAIYPQSKPLIDQSTLVKVEGNITIHSTPETTTEGFVFVMPETHPAVTGFEIMLRWLFPLYDVFALYGRPTRLIADTSDTRSLMFALPSERRYGYLDILDVAGLIHENGSHIWNEQEWRRRLKELTATQVSRMNTEGARPRSRASSMNRRHRNSLPNRANTLKFEDGASIRSNPSLRNEHVPSPPPHKSDSAPQNELPFRPPPVHRTTSHQRSVSEALPYSNPRYQKSQRSIREHEYAPSRLSHETQREVPMEVAPPLPPPHGNPYGEPQPPMHNYREELANHERSSSESESRFRDRVDLEAQDVRHDVRPAPPPVAVAAPPAFAHEPGVKPQKRPVASPEMRRANSRLSITTLSQLTQSRQGPAPDSPMAGIAAAGASAAWRTRSNEANGAASAPDQGGYRSAAQSPHRDGRYAEDQGQRGVNDGYSYEGTTADPPHEGLVLAKASHTNGAVPKTSAPAPLEQYPPRGYDSTGSHGINTGVDRSANARDLSDGKDFLPNVETRGGGSYSGSGGYDRQNRNVYDMREHEAPAVFRMSPAAPIQSTTAEQGFPFADVRSTSHPEQQHLPPSNNLQHSITDNRSDDSALDRSIENQLPIQQLLPPKAQVGNHHPATSPQSEHRPQASRRFSIPRKPVPQRSSTQPDIRSPSLEAGPERRSSLDSLQNHVIDEAALDQVLAHGGSRTTTMDSRVNPNKDIDESIYDDDASSKSPSYASTRPSVETRRSKKSIDPPRRGVLKTVGQVQPEAKEVVVGDAHYRPEIIKSDIETSIPDIDFGPTQAMRPTTSSGVQRPQNERPKSSFLEDSQTPAHQLANPKVTENDSKDSRVQSPQSVQPARYRNTIVQQAPETDRRRSQMWSGPAVNANNRQSVTPEEFAQQSYLASKKPQYALPKVRTPSNPAAFSRNSSGDFTPQHSRQSSASPLASMNSSTENVPLNHSRQGSHSRPQSALMNRPTTPSPRNTLMGRSTTPSPRIPSHNNQDYFERKVSSPLINLRASSRTPEYGPGLIHHIGAREQEKREIKDAINQRAVQDAQQSQQQHMRQSSYSSQMQMQMPGQWPSTPQYVMTPQAQYTPSAQYGQTMPTNVQQQQQQQQQQTVYQQPALSYQQHMNPQYQPQVNQTYSQANYGQQQYSPQYSQQQQQQYFTQQSPILLNGQNPQTYFQQQPWIIGGTNAPPQNVRSPLQQSSSPRAEGPPQQQQQGLVTRASTAPYAAPNSSTTTTTSTTTSTTKTGRRSSWFGRLGEQFTGATADAGSEGRNKDQVKK